MPSGPVGRRGAGVAACTALALLGGMSDAGAQFFCPDDRIVGDLAECGPQPFTDEDLNLTLYVPADWDVFPQEDNAVVLAPRFAGDEADCTIDVLAGVEAADGSRLDAAAMVDAMRPQRPSLRLREVGEMRFGGALADAYLADFRETADHRDAGLKDAAADPAEDRTEIGAAVVAHGNFYSMVCDAVADRFEAYRPVFKALAGTADFTADTP